MDKRVKRFQEVAKKRWQCLNSGDSKRGNECYDILLKIAKELREEKLLIKLEILLNDKNEGVIFEAASKLLTINSKKALKAIKKITSKKGLLPFTAKMTIREWELGNLKF